MSTFSRPGFVQSLHIAALFNIGVVHPVFDVVADSVEFMIMRDVRSEELLAIVFLFSFLLPALASLIVFVGGKINRALGAGLCLFLIAVLLSANFAFVATKVSPLAVTANLIVSCAAAILTTATYYYFQNVRSFVTFLSPAILVVPSLFLINPAVKKVAFPAKLAIEMPQTKANTPLILVVFDELPLNALLDEHGKIDAKQYPNFAALASHFTWYQNATTVAGYTTYAVPAILTGRIGPPGTLPLLRDHQKNLFTLLGGTYQLNVVESLTRLCPNPLWRARRQRFVVRLQILVQQFQNVYVQILSEGAPDSLRADIPQRWIDVNLHHPATIRIQLFNRFLNSIRTNRNRSLYFVHALLPHNPYEFLPSGKKYYRNWSKTPLGYLTADDDLREWRYSFLHQLQLRYVDSLIGRLLRRLHQTRLYNRAMIVVTADHGVNFHPGQPTRAINPSNFVSIMSVPLFVKFPGQRKGAVNSANVQTIDILPTIIETLGINTPWQTEGTSLKRKSAARRHKEFFDLETRKILRFSPSMWLANKAVVDRRLSLFGDGEDLIWIKTNPHKDLIGRKAEEVQTGISSQLTAEVYEEEQYGNVDLHSHYVPALVMAYLHSHTPLKHKANIGFAINGVFRSVTTSFQYKDNVHIVAGIVAEKFFRQGRNDVKLYLLNDRSVELLRRK